MLCSYLAVLAAPLAAIAIFYIETNQAMLSVQYEKSYRLQREAVTSFERQVTEAGNVAVYLMGEPDMERMMSAYDSRSQELWDKYQYAQAKPDYSLTNQIIEYVYILAKESRYIIRVPVVVPREQLGYQTVRKFEAESYDQLMDQLCAGPTYGNIMLLEDGNGNQNMMMLYSVARGKEIEGVVAVMFNSAVVDSILKNCNLYECSVTCILNGEGGMVRTITGSGASPETEEIAADMSGLEEGYQVEQIGGEKYLICTRQGGVQGWQYVTATPLRVLTEQIRGIRIWLVVLSCMAFLISLFICMYHWSKKRAVIRQCCVFQERQEQDGKIRGTYTRSGFWGGAKAAFDYLENLQATLSLQESLVRSSVLRNLIYGNYAGKEELLPDLEHAQLLFPVQIYYAAVWSFDGVLSSGIFKDMVEFRTYIRSFVKECGLPFHYIYEMNYNTLAVLICDPSVHSLAEVKNLFLARNNQLREQVFVDGYTGAAGPAEDLLELAVLFEKAKDACEYARYYKMAVPMEKEEIPELTANLFFTPELERHFCEAIKDGSDKELCLIMGQIRCKIEKQKPSIPIANHYMNFVRSAVIRTLSEYSSEQAVLDQVAKISEAEGWEELFRLTIEAKNMICERREQEADTETEETRRELMDRIRKHCGEPSFNLAELAEEYGVSESKMYKDFKLYFGKSFAETLENVRIEKACRLLDQGMAVKEVTKQTGYSSDVSFRRAFKRVVGVNPTEFVGRNA